MLIHVRSQEMAFTFQLTVLGWNVLSLNDYLALMPRSCWIARRCGPSDEGKELMVGLLTGKDGLVSPLHIFTLSVHSKTN
jgi:hypothetical protein